MYPVILIIIALVAVVTLFWFVLPQIFDIASSFNNVQLPWITQALKDMSDFLILQWKSIIGVIA